MLELKRITDKSDVTSLATRYSLKAEDELEAYTAENRDELFGICFYRLTADGMEIIFAETNGDVPLFDGLLRAAMALLFNRENDEVTFGAGMNFDLLHACRFAEKEGMRIKSANEFFKTCKNCKN